MLSSLLRWADEITARKPLDHQVKCRHLNSCFRSLRPRLPISPRISYGSIETHKAAHTHSDSPQSAGNSHFSVNQFILVFCFSLPTRPDGPWFLPPTPPLLGIHCTLSSLIFFASTHLLPPRATCPPGERLNCTLSSSFVLWGYKLETPQVVWGNLGVKGLCQRLTKSWKENVYHVPTTCATLLDLSICIHFSWGVLIQGPERYWGYLLRGLEVCATHLYIETNPPHDLAWGSIRSHE